MGAEAAHREAMTNVDAERYVREHGRSVPLPEGQLPRAAQIECIDDRGSVEEGNPNALKYPGGALGMVLTAAAACNRLGASDKISLKQITDHFEQKLGGMSFHTDTHSKGDPLPVAGCGHAKGALTQDSYGLGSYREGVTEYARDLKTRSKEGGDPPVKEYVYSGDHKASAVLIINDNASDQYLSLPGRAGGEQVFVVNDALNRRIVVALAQSLYSALKTEFDALDISEKRLADTMIKTYADQLEVTRQHLAKTLPVHTFDMQGEEPVLRP